MTTTAQPYGVFLTDLGSGVHNFSSDTDKVVLLTPAYVPNYDTHTSYADVKNSEVSGTGYTAGGITLAGKSWAYNSSSHNATLSADPVNWNTLSATTRFAAVYQSSGSDSSSKLIGLIDFGEDRVYDSEPLQLSFPSGVVTIQPA
jgi:hypothetical protein